MTILQHVSKTVSGAYFCSLCNPRAAFTVRVPKGSGMGRGYGLASSSRARAEVAKHIREKHAGMLRCKGP